MGFPCLTGNIKDGRRRERVCVCVFLNRVRSSAYLQTGPWAPTRHEPPFRQYAQGHSVNHRRETDHQSCRHPSPARWSMTLPRWSTDAENYVAVGSVSLSSSIHYKCLKLPPPSSPPGPSNE